VTSESVLDVLDTVVQYSTVPAHKRTVDKDMKVHTAHDGGRRIMRFDQKRAKKRVRPLARLHLQGFLIAELCDRTYMRFDYLI
jgi:hypothetical protein